MAFCMIHCYVLWRGISFGEVAADNDAVVGYVSVSVAVAAAADI